jgi:hypothetical protein
VELLVVIAIIGTLVALTAAAAVGVMGVQKQATTELTLQTLAGQLNQQWQAVVGKAKTEPISPQAQLLAQPAGPNYDKRARVIHIKLSLRQQFPLSFAEVLTNNPAALTRVKAYQEALLQQGVTGAGPAPQAVESSALLLLALQSGRGGSSLTQDALGSMVADGAYLNPQGTPIAVKHLVDAWGAPVVYFRWPTGNPEVDASNPSRTGANSLYRDPEDPEGLLLDASWNNQVAFNNNQGVKLFTQLCHPVGEIVGNVYRPRAYYTVPVVASAGKNKRLGLHPFLMTPEGTDAEDNLYSFRLRLGGRGD